MLRTLLSISVACLLITLGQLPVAFAEKRVALVIGNSAYENVSPLIISTHLKVAVVMLEEIPEVIGL